MTAYFVTGRWFRAQGVTVKLSQHDAKPIVPVKRQLTKAQSGPDRMSSRRLAQQTAIKQPSTLLLCDFDKTIADFDAGEHLLQLGLHAINPKHAMGIMPMPGGGHMPHASLALHCIMILT